MPARPRPPYGRGTMNEQLSALDATFLELEEADASAHMHIGSLAIFEAPADGRIPTVDDLAEHLERRFVALPRYGQRLSERHTGGMSWPHWEDDPHFDLANHIRRAVLPAPGGEADLFEWVSDYWSHRLDRARPLWEMVVVEGLTGGRWALASKTHHCMLDGRSSVDVGFVMLDGERHPAPVRWSPPDVNLVGRNGDSPVRRLAGSLAHTLDPRNAREVLHRSRAAAAMLVRDELVAAAHSSLNEPIGAERRIAAVSAWLDDLKAIKLELGGTVNDVALAAVAGGLRALLLARGEEPPEAGLRAMVPVNLRSAGDRLSLGNRVSSLFVHLPVADADPLERYRSVVAETQRLKADDEALGTSTVIDLTALAPPVVHAMLARSLYATRLFNVTVTNVPGPPETLYGFGCALEQVFGLVPLAAEHALGVCIVSYAGELTFTIAADHDSVPDIGVFADGIEATLTQLRALVPA
jgi:diacylglycerol O-acyltransferase / wax synthase